ncbi:hypothetical protein RJ639_001320, partial [Escallonia herrerae]
MNNQMHRSPQDVNKRPCTPQLTFAAAYSVKFSNLGNEHILAGISPESLLCATLSCSKLFIPPIDSGRVPTSALELTSNTVKLSNNPISLGKHPLNPTLLRIISFRVLRILAMLGGKQPLKLLLANTKADTFELPKLLGNVEFEKKAKITKCLRQGTTKAVGVYVKEGKVREEAELLGSIPATVVISGLSGAGAQKTP